MTTTTAQAAIEASAPPVIRYRSQGGALVRVIEVEQKTGNPDQWDYRFVGQCAGCLDTEGSTRIPLAIGAARTWAAKHAATCHALAPVDAEAQSISSVYLGVAHDLIERAREVPRISSDEKQRVALMLDTARTVTAFALAAHQIGA